MPRIVRSLRKNVGELTRAVEEGIEASERQPAKRCKSFKHEASSFSAPRKHGGTADDVKQGSPRLAGKSDARWCHGSDCVRKDPISLTMQLFRLLSLENGNVFSFSFQMKKIYMKKQSCYATKPLT